MLQWAELLKKSRGNMKSDIAKPDPIIVPIIVLPEAPWGGLKGSGHGIELSEFSFYEYSAMRHINYETGTENRREWWFPYS